MHNGVILIFCQRYNSNNFLTRKDVKKLVRHPSTLVLLQIKNFNYNDVIKTIWNKCNSHTARCRAFYTRLHIFIANRPRLQRFYNYCSVYYNEWCDISKIQSQVEFKLCVSGDFLGLLMIRVGK